MNNAIELTGLTKRFKKVEAVRGIDLTVQSGEIVALLGANGAGKTTTIDMILGLAKPTAGHVAVFGSEPRVAVQKGKVSALLQTGGLLDDLKVGETVDYIASTYRATQGRAVLEQAGIAHLENRIVSKCSGGEQQRLKFALALLPNPDLLILDEPTTGMDVSARRAFWERMKEQAHSGRTIVFATHYLEEAEQFAERVVLMHKGQIVADGSTSEVRAFTGNRTISCDTPDPNGLLAEIQAHFDVVPRRDLGRFAVTSHQSDEVARFLLGRDSVANLEITSPSLEDAFVNLTGE